MTPTAGDVDAFLATIADRLGLELPASRRGDAVEALAEALARSGCRSVAEYAPRLAGPELHAVAERVTVGESYFLRNPGHFRTLAQFAQARRGRIRVLSAGCSTGEEAYSAAITLHEALGAQARVEVEGVDVNEASLARARAATYGAWSLRHVPPGFRARWFEAVAGGALRVKDEVRRLVRFRPGNLSRDSWSPGAWDAVFCRNVLIYFSAAAARSLAERLAASLAPGGLLFLGDAETLRVAPAPLVVRHAQGTFHYEATTDPAPARAAAPAPDWPAEVERTTARLAALAAPVQPPDATPPDPLADAEELLRAERFTEAVARLDRLPALDAAGLLLRAAALANGGDAERAEVACREALAGGAPAADARYLLGLVRERLLDRAGAVDEQRLAARLDAGFAMPRLRLGLLARRRGDEAEARAHLAAAVDLLRGETERRLLLHGGGFGRAGLEALCRAELAACGPGARSRGLA